MAYYSTTILEEELKNKIASDWFDAFDCTKIIGRVDFCVSKSEKNLIWAEAKRGKNHNIYDSFVQLILTFGRERTFDKHMPPAYIGAFDAEKIAFIQYNKIMDIFSMNDFDWTVTPSNHSTREFMLLKDRVGDILKQEKYLFDYEKDVTELKSFITNLNSAENPKFLIDKNNFIHIYYRWIDEVKPTIDIDWEDAKKQNYLDADFYLADILSQENTTLLKKLFILLKNDHYVYNAGHNGLTPIFGEISFTDNQKKYNEFWQKYERPPKKEYWEYLVSRRDLLIPPDVRERKGSFFTPQKWVTLSQEYIAKSLGENWQQEYTIWDCCAGTGNLLNGLIGNATNESPKAYNIYASTLDKADVDTMQTMIDKGYSKSLIPNHVFQFDFLNGDFKDLPESLQTIINDPEARRKLVIYINPPYAEVSSINGGKKGVNASKIHDQYIELLGTAGRELFTQILMRIYKEIPGCIIAEFSSLKTLQGAGFETYRKNFRAKLCSMFVCPADSFDNVKGQFPIGFKIWNTGVNEPFKSIEADVYDIEDKKAKYSGKKEVKLTSKSEVISNWISENRLKTGKAFLCGTNGNDFQHNNIVYILNDREQMANPRGVWMDAQNLIQCYVYFAIRQCIPATWLNDRDQFLSPDERWQNDLEFQSDCLVYSLFHNANRVSMNNGINHFIPFSENTVEPKDRYTSHFLLDFLNGKYRLKENKGMFDGAESIQKPVEFSENAQIVMDCAKKIYKYYHSGKDSKPDASFYDIRLYFQGRDDKGRMNSRSEDSKYSEILSNLRLAHKILAKKIEGKVYEYKFLIQ